MVLNKRFLNPDTRPERALPCSSDSGPVRLNQATEALSSSLTKSSAVHLVFVAQLPVEGDRALCPCSAVASVAGGGR